MSDLESVSSQIRFHLSQMRAKNQQHELERLAFHLARATITANVVPATGPVQAGGDQGRDFETFRSHLRATDIGESAFAARISDVTIAFACSLEQEIVAKIKEDVGKILGTGTKVDEVHYYCEVDLPVAKRHALQKWAITERNGLHLEIHDGQAISTELSNDETFWIAQRFLGVPAEIFPRISAAEPDQWYEDARALWQRTNVVPIGVADFAALRQAARFALFSDDFAIDVAFWIKRLEVLRANATPTFRRRVETEIITLAMRSSRSLSGFETLVREHFGSIKEFSDSLDLHNAATAVAYVVGSVIRGTCSLVPDEVLTWQRQLLARVEQLLGSSDLGTSTRADLLETAGTLQFTLPSLSGKGPDVDGAVTRWMEMTALLPEAPLFNLSRFVDSLNVMTPLLADHMRFHDLTAAVDDELQKRLGAIAVGEKARDRAIALYRSGRILRAIEELHRVKVQWFADESLRGAILAMLLLSNWYLELRLHFAAKYYALAAVIMLVRRPKFHGEDLLGRSLVEVGRADFGQGAFSNLLGIVEVTAIAFQGAMGSATDELPERLQDFVINLCTVCVIAEKLDATTGADLERIVTTGALGNLTKDALPLARERWETTSPDEMWAHLEQVCIAPPFSDVGPTRTASWVALGVTWNVHWSNTYSTAAVAEEFCAVLQVVLGDLASHDLCLLPTTIDVTVVVRKGAKVHLEDLPSNAGRLWAAVLPPTTAESGGIEDLQTSILAMAATMLRDCSLLPDEQFKAAIEDEFRRGITMKTFVARPYQEIFRDVLRPTDFAIRDQIHPPANNRRFTPKPHDLMRWREGLGPTFDGTNAEEQVRTRYMRTVPPIQQTLKRLKSRKTFQKVVSALREKGWHDWHILTALMNVALNHRIHKSGEPSDAAMNELTKRLLNEGESAGDAPIPVNVFTLDALEAALQTTWINTVRNNNLELYQATPDFPSIEKFLAVRYRYWDIDVPHDDPFS